MSLKCWEEPDYRMDSERYWQLYKDELHKNTLLEKQIQLLKKRIEELENENN